MDTRNSQKKSRHNSAKSERNRVDLNPGSGTQRPDQDAEQEEYIDRSIDHVARVRAAKVAAQREREAFGDVSEYDITIIHGQLREAPAQGPQTSLEFEKQIAAERMEEN
ncbi:MAG TPA: hypothetical protein VGD59_05820 [Acidisarcina sp.]